MVKIKDLRINDELKVVKNLFYFTEDSMTDNQWYTKEEVFKNLANLICKDDIWKVIGFDGDRVELECIEGSMKGEFNDGWFDLEYIIDKDCFELI